MLEQTIEKALSSGASLCGSGSEDVAPVWGILLILAHMRKLICHALKCNVASDREVMTAHALCFATKVVASTSPVWAAASAAAMVLRFLAFHGDENCFGQQVSNR